MRPKFINPWITVFGLGGVLLPTAAFASGPLPVKNDDLPYEFALQGGRSDYTWKRSGADVDTEVEMMSLFVRRRLAGIVYGDLLLGYTALTQTGNAATSGLKPDGYHAGLSVDVDILTREHFSVFGSAGYIYYYTRDSSSSNRVELTWGEWRARLGGSIGYGIVRLYGGGPYGSLDGTERQTGTVNQTVRFDSKSQGGGFIGLDLRLNNDGYIGVEGRSGLDDGWLIYFKHRFD